MIIAIHHRPGSFSAKWIEYCDSHGIAYEIVNCYDSFIVGKLAGCDGLMWHWQQDDYKAINFARQLTYSIENAGKNVFPNSRTCWHFDDKVGQKYLLEAVGAPLVNSYVFYDKVQALQWARNTAYPKVFKQRGGAGSMNVKLVRNRRQAFSLIRKAFGKGFSPADNKEKVKDRWVKWWHNLDKISFCALTRGLGLWAIPSFDRNYRHRSPDKGYIYFQDLIPNNDHDIRIIVIGKRAFAIKRLVRKNSFKASGSGRIVFNKEDIPIECVRTAFELNKKLKTQCIAYDFVSSEGQFKLVEISYGFSARAYDSCPGYWDQYLEWHEGAFVPEWFMIEDFVREIRQ